MQAFYEGLAEILEIDVNEVSPSLDLTRMDWDSLAFISTIALVDDCFNVMLNGDSLAASKTVGDIEKIISQKQKG
ncbi:acyl carrier protein [Nostoc sphaeroides]|uniref:AcpP, acyl carrier protein n=1 Tax=Nostoc sphaeroides CCNUC1 TaxID=2653204 RepID=A0A5P8VS42_9NOSO|nr:acyl carrier protein [Nostoc sphaeroides]QFS43160.1 acpP, acyl carrier protein [Nostoc sphaeroides CCNUC1]